MQSKDTSIIRVLPTLLASFNIQVANAPASPSLPAIDAGAENPVVTPGFHLVPFAFDPMSLAHITTPTPKQIYQDHISVV